MIDDDKERPVAIIDAELEDIIDDFFRYRRRDLAVIAEALETGDAAAIRTIGHNLKGSGGNYGFEEISRIGRLIEQAAERNDADTIRLLVNELADYLDRVVVTYSGSRET